MADLTVACRTLGCKVNRVEADKIAAQLLGSGVSIVEEEDAAVVIITTCTVTGEADHKARKAIRHALGLPQSPVVVVSGCLASIDSDGLAALGERVVVEAEKEAVAARVAAILGTKVGSSVPRAGEGFRTRAAVKIEDGCDAFCTYCIVPYARGVPRSVPLHDVIAEVGALVEQGVAEVVLTGINIGRYADGPHRLPELIDAVAGSGIARVRVSSIEPGDVDERLLDIARCRSTFCEHLHIPLQSGCDRTLAAMGRTYDTAGYAAVLDSVRSALPDVAITTDVLAGFPGETDADFERTLAFVESCGFSRLHVFRYSQRAGTPAAAMTGQVHPKTKSERARILRSLDARLRSRFAASRIGREVEVLVERVDEEGTAEGTTREYLQVSMPAQGAVPGSIVKARLTGVERGRMTAAW